MSADTILGVSPGTRVSGIAVLQGGMLVHSQVRSFQGAWSDAKLHTIISLIEATMQRYGVTTVVVKVPDVLPLSKGFHQLIGSINVLCERKGIKPMYYSLSEIKTRHCKERLLTRDELMGIIVARHSELSLEYKREQQNRNAYYYKMFEAVGAAMMK